MSKPLAIDLYCGLGGWTDGLLAEGWDVIGFDIEQHVYGEERYPGMLVVQDVMTVHGSQFKNADLIVGSSPCTKYSYMAMPWKRAKAQAAEIRADATGEKLRQLNALYDAQFRIQREASAAAGRHIPMIVENVRGAQEWVGRAAWNYGSYYLWGDVPALMPRAFDARKVPGFRFDGSGASFQTAAVNAHVAEGRKHSGDWFRDPTCPTRQGGQVKRAPKTLDGIKQSGISGVRENGKGSAWFQDGASANSSNSPARKAASAKIAKIPFALSSHIARVYLPRAEAA